jgi:hypothetical protein
MQALRAASGRKAPIAPISLPPPPPPQKSPKGGDVEDAEAEDVEMDVEEEDEDIDNRLDNPGSNYRDTGGAGDAGVTTDTSAAHEALLERYQNLWDDSQVDLDLIYSLLQVCLFIAFSSCLTVF